MKEVNNFIMIHNDYSNMKSLRFDWIRWPCIWVTTRQVPSYLDGAPFGSWCETWVFSDCPAIRTAQITKKTAEHAIKAHEHIVNNLKEVLKQYLKWEGDDK